MTQKLLINNLNKLNQWLASKNKFIELHIIGAYALHLHKINIERLTQDIDSVLEITEEDVIDKIHQIGKSSGQPNWFDLSAHSLSLPSGYEKRLIKMDSLSNIDLYVLSINDLIILKISAYFLRRERGITRDLEDLLKMAPTSYNIEQGIAFIYEDGVKAQHPDKFLKTLKIELDDLRRELIGFIKEK